MLNRFIAIVMLAAPLLIGQPPSPRDHLGFEPGADFKLADYNDLYGYFRKLAAASPRIRLEEFGRTSLGKPMLLAYISDAENLERLPEFKLISQRLALARTDAGEARKIAAQGKAIVWIDAGLHASEVAPTQHSFDLAYRMVTGEDAETRRIRKNVILLQVPCINPDGLDMVVHWYRKNTGTPYELASPPGLYQKYAGHDNNRDYFMLNLEETRNVTRMMFREWFPQIVYNQHQMPAFPARIFVPPYAEPLNPHIPAAVMEGIHLIGSAMKERFAREGKPGVLSYYGFDAWWNGGLRSVPAFHNMHGILTETAGYAYATPREYKLSELPDRFANGIPTKEPSVFYQRPWLGGRWSIRDAMDYNLTADFAILDLAASLPERFLFKAWETARANIELGKKGKPFAYVIPAEQHDRWSATEMLWRLAAAGVEVQRSRSAFKANGRSYAEGVHVLAAGQPFRPYLVDLMEPQVYPEMRSSPGGPARRPYDIAGWTLPMQMGVTVDRVDEPFQAELEPVTGITPLAPVLDHRDNSSFLATADLLGKGGAVRWASDGAILTTPGAQFDKAAWELRRPRVAIYEPYSANMDQGWTEWLLDTFRIPFTRLHNADFQTNGLSERLDTIIFASQSSDSILFGLRAGESDSRSGAGRPRSIPRPEHTGGIGAQGTANLEKFVLSGGTLLALAGATDLPLQSYPLAARNILRRPAEAGADSAAGSFFCPGSLLRVTVDTGNPIAFGMPREAIVFSSGGHAFDTLGQDARAVVRFGQQKLLASGWLSGEGVIQGKAAVVEAKYGKGRVVLYGIRVQHRGQPFGTFKLLMNAIYLGSAKPLQ
jgi:hypothetical protein